MSAFMPDRYVQIDVKEIKDSTAVCNLYTGQRCVKVIMLASDYESLQRDGFFIRDGQSKDSAGVLNTSNEYFLTIKQ
jgi:hypothetical protein